ncbi:MAG: leucine--tRNA ligase [Nanoarchaeota archaeon]|nr:leucine--tRNA ligase [Nanoarchaeota archaeon]
MIDFKKIESKWQKKWETAKVFKAKDSGEKCYVLEMYPYPSGFAGHVGHARNYVIGDSFARFKRMQGINVLYPMGWDAFGQPTENAAIQLGIHPMKSMGENIARFKEQLRQLSLSYDWSREINTSDPEYYKWTQWIFLKLFENKLAYKKFAPGNWCPSCKTVLSNEDSKDGKCWRCDSEVIQKDIDQWFFKITDYADRLLNDLNKIEWSERLKSLQTNWIGKSHGINLIFPIKDSKKELISFTTRPDTYFGITFVAIAPEHPLIPELIKDSKNKKEIDDFIKDTNKLSELERTSLLKEKKGIFTGKYIINPVTHEEIPIYLANYVVGSYGTGVVIGVPTHDQRDFEFAKQYGIKLKIVITPKDKTLVAEQMNRAYTENGVMVNSGEFDGILNSDGIREITDHLVKMKWGERTTNYKLRDWCVSRQRYWGAPIPIVYCDKCGTVPIPEKDLPVKLPLDVQFGKKGAAPLATNEKFVNTKCPKCKGPAKRETDTMTTFVDSAWYYLRYCSPKNKEAPFDKKSVKYWMPVDQYIGGIEHAVGHLMYSRFITKFLKDKGYLDFDEPFKKLLNQGMINKDGIKMSKSKGNVVDPIDMIEKFGSDTLRTYLLFMAHPSKDLEWSDAEMVGISKFIDRTYNMLEDMKKAKGDKYINSITQTKIKNVTKHMNGLDHNLAIIELLEFGNKLTKRPSLYAYKIFLKLLSPFAPCVVEECWNKLGEKKMMVEIEWPEVDLKKLNPTVEAAEDYTGVVINDINEIIKLSQMKPEKITLFVSPAWKYETYQLLSQDKQLRDIMQVEHIRKHGNEVAGYFTRLVKRKPLIELILTASAETDALKDKRGEMEKTFGCKIEIISGEKSNLPKAKIAEPGKPGILIV